MKDIVAQLRHPVSVVAPLSPSAAQALQGIAGEFGPQVVIAESFDEGALRQAGVGEADQVLILADWTQSSTGVTETDVKTVMAAMTVRKISPEVPVAAEILSPDFTQHLKMAGVEELIFSREYSRALLVNAAQGAGVAHIIHDLLGGGEGDQELQCWEIDPKWFKRPYGDFVRALTDTDPLRPPLCIGLLENTQPLHKMKRMAVSEAQKTSEIRETLRRLTDVKSLVNHHPRLNPMLNYPIPEFAMAIVLHQNK